MRVGSLEIELLANVARLQRDMDQARQTVDRTMGQIERSVEAAKRAFVGLGLALGGRELVAMADQYTSMVGKIKNATESQAQFNQVLLDSRRIAATAQVEVSAIAQSYARLINNTRDIAGSQKSLSGVVEATTLALKVNGATVQETSSALTQLSQAFGKGKLDGDEFRTMMEAAPGLMRQVAESMGVPFGALKDLAAQGKVTAEVLLKALSDKEYLDRLRQEAKEVMTISGAFTDLNNELMMFVGAQAKTSSAVSTMISAIDLLTKNLALLGSAVTGFIAMKLAHWIIATTVELYKKVAALTVSTAALNAQRAATLSAAAAEVARIESLIAALNADRARTVAQMQAAQATMAATQAMGAQSAALRAYTLAAAANAQAVTDLTLLGRAQATANAQLTVAQNALNAALTATTVTATRASRALALVGGPIGAISLVLGVGVTAWMAWRSAAETENAKAQANVEQTTEDIIKDLNKQIDKLRLRNKLAAEVPSEVVNSSQADKLARLRQDMRDAEKGTGKFAGMDEKARLDALHKLSEQFGRMYATVQNLNEEEAKAAAAASKHGDHLLEIRQKLVGVNKQYLDDLQKLQAAREAGVKGGGISEEEYIKLVSELANETYAASNAGKAAAKAAKEHGKELDKQVSSAERYLESLQQQTAEIGKTKEQLILMRAAREAAAAPTKALTDEIMRAAEANIAAVKANEELEASEKRAKEGKEAALKILKEHREEQLKAIADAEKEVKRYEYLAETFGKTADQIKAMELARLEERLAQRSSNALTLEEIENLEKLIDAKKRAAAAADILVAKEKSKEAADAHTKAWTKANDTIEKSLTDSLMNGFKKGESFGKNLINTLKQAFNNLVLRPIIQAIVKPAAGAMASAFSSSASAFNMGSTGGGIMDMVTSMFSSGGSGAGGGIMNLMSAGKTLWEGFAGGMGASIGGLVSAAGNMLGSSAASAFGAGMGMTSAQAAQAAAAYSSAGMSSTASAIGYGQMAGSAAGLAGGIAGGIYGGRMMSGGYSAVGSSGNSMVNAGTALGTLFGGPLGAAIGGVIGGVVNRLFGRKPKEVTSFGIEGDFGIGGFEGRNFANWKQKGGVFRSDKHGTDFSALDPVIARQFSDGIGTVKGQTVAFANTLGLTADEIGTYSKKIKINLTKDTEKNQKIIAELFATVGDELAQHVAPGIRGFTKAGETSSGTLQRLSVSLTTVNSWLSMFRQRLFQVSLAGGNAASKLADAFGGLENLTKASSEFYQLYYTEGERAEHALNGIRDALAGVNLAMPQTKDELRAMASSIDLTTESGRTAYATLLSLAPEFANATAAAAQFAKETASKLVAAFSGNGALVPVLNAAALSVQGLGESVTTTSTTVGYISRLFLDAGSGLIAFNAAAGATAPILTDAQRANLLLNDQIDALRMRAGQATIDIKGLGVALSEFDTATFTAAISLVFETLAERIRDTVGKIGDERIAIREAAQQIINPTVMSKQAIQGGIASISTKLPSSSDLLLTQKWLTQADAFLTSIRKESQPVLDNAMYTLKFYTEQKAINERMYLQTGDAFYKSMVDMSNSWITYSQTTINAKLADIAYAEANKTKAEQAAKAAQIAYADALQTFAIDAGKSVSKLTRLREETMKYYEAQQQLAALMKNSAATLRQTVSDYRFGQMTPQQQFEQLQTQFATAYAMALSTDGEALAGYGDKLNSLLNPLLEKAREVYGDGTMFNSFSATTIARAEAIASRLESLTPTNYAADSLMLLGQIDATLAALDESSRSAEKLIVDAINASRDQTVGGLRAVVAALTGQTVPAFAAGGFHSGGLRLVGEHGPELEVTGPSRIFNAAQTRSIMSGGGSNAELVQEIRALRAEVAGLRTEARATATYTNKTTRLLERFEIDGLTVKTDADTPLHIEAE